MAQLSKATSTPAGEVIAQVDGVCGYDTLRARRMGGPQGLLVDVRIRVREGAPRTNSRTSTRRLVRAGGQAPDGEQRTPDRREREASRSVPLPLLSPSRASPEPDAETDVIVIGSHLCLRERPRRRNHLRGQ